MTQYDMTAALAWIMKDSGDAVRQYLGAKKTREDDALIENLSESAYHVGRLAMLREISRDLEGMKNDMAAMDRMKEE